VELSEFGQRFGLRANACTFPVTFATGVVQHVVDAVALEEGKPLWNCWHLGALSVAIPLQQHSGVVVETAEM
jgi:hypothetical protein